MPGLDDRISFVPALGRSEPWRFLTSAFAHGGLTHIAFNMYALWVMGTYLEPMLGRARFVAIYLLSALGGSVMYLLLSSPPSVADVAARDFGSWYTGAVGASGAVFGLFGAFLVLQRRLGRSAAGMYVVIGINAVLGFVVPGIAWQAHLGGLLTGAAVAAVIAYTGRARGPVAPPPNRTVHWFSMGGILLVLVVLTVAKYALSRLTRSRQGPGYTGVIRPQWGQPLWTTWRRSSAPPGRHEEPGEHEAEADGEVPALERRHRVLVDAGDVVGDDPDQADDHEAEHEGHVPARVGALVLLRRARRDVGGLAATLGLGHEHSPRGVDGIGLA